MGLFENLIGLCLRLSLVPNIFVPYICRMFVLPCLLMLILFNEHHKILNTLIATQYEGKRNSKESAHL